MKNISDSQALETAIKALTDVGFGTKNLTMPRARFMEEGGSLLLRGIPFWLVSFTLDKNIFGDDPPLKVFVAVQDSNGLAHNITRRSGFDLLGYDASTDKYFKKPKPQPK